jgi:Lrp/AsnC family leucine-responsive transcriptional regulator
MRGLDDTDRQILQLLLEDGRRPFSDIADEVGLSAPSVSDRIDRLQEIGLIRRFTVDLDRSLLDEGVPVLVDLAVEPGESESVRDEIEDIENVGHVFTTADERIVFTVTAPDGDVTGLLTATLDMDEIDSYEVDLLADTDWQPTLGDVEFAATCVECGNRVTSEGARSELDDRVYHFCCENCQSVFLDRYEELRQGA